LGVLPPWARPWMKYKFFDKFWSDNLGATSDLGKVGREAFEHRSVLSESREDLLIYLLAGKNEQGRGPLSDEEIIAESISFIVSGSDTTSSTMTNFSTSYPATMRFNNGLWMESAQLSREKQKRTGSLQTAMLSICLSSMQLCVRSCVCVQPAPQASSE
jgi:hypothetical protein